VANVEKKSLETPDETRTFDKGQVQVVNIGGGVVGRYRLEPGWRWSEHVKPIAGTDLCQSAHLRLPDVWPSPRCYVRWTRI